MMRYLLAVLAVFGVAGVAAAQQCGYVNNQYVCTQPPNCGYVNGVYTCAGGSGSGGPIGGAAAPTDSGVTLGTQTLAGAAADGFGSVISSLANWLLSALEFIPEWIWSQFLGAIAYTVGQIPVPDAINQFKTHFGSLPSGVVWFLDLIRFKAQLGFIFGAVLIRFLMTWIPFAGPKA